MKSIGLLSWVLALALPAFSQTFGDITGVVTDPSGAVLVNATVSVTNPQTNLTRTGSTNNAGAYAFPALLPGVYNVRAEMPGFQAEIRTGVELQVQQTARIDFQLKVGGVAEAVEVQGGAPLLATENATVGTVIENRRIVELPLNGRNFLSLIALSPNVTATYADGGSNAGAAQRQGGDRSGQNFSVAGMRREFNYYTLDGITNTDVDFNTYVFLPSIDALQEFKVQTGIYSAEFGREASQVNVSTKAGTNDYHGALFDFIRNNKLDARPFGFTTVVPDSAPFKWNQYGFTVGGPVRIPKMFNGKDRLFFTSNFEGFRLRNQTQVTYSVPSVAMRGGDFSQILPGTKVTDPLNNNQPFPNNIIPSNRFDKAAIGLLEFYPPPNIPGAGLVNNYLSLQNNTSDKDQFTQRIDFVESAKSNWFGRYSWQDEYQVQPALKLNGHTLAVNVKQAMISNTRVLSPTMVNEFRFGYSGFHNNLANELQYKRDVIKELGIGAFDPPPAAWGTPGVSILGFSGFGDDVNGPFIIHDHTFQWIDGLSWTRGKHSLKMGFEFRRDRFNQVGNQNARSSLAVQNQATGYGFGDYLLGYIQQIQDAGGLAISQYRATDQAYYINDNWKVTPNLTIDFGVRYEYNPPWSSKNDTTMNIWFPVGFGDKPDLQPCYVRIGSGDVYANSNVRFDPRICVTRDGRLGDRLVQADHNDFAPRLGVAWSPTQKTTVRAGFGFFYVQDTGNPRFDMSRNLFGRVTSVANIQTHNLTFEQPFAVSVDGLRSAQPAVRVRDFTARPVERLLSPDSLCGAIRAEHSTAAGRQHGGRGRVSGFARSQTRAHHVEESARAGAHGNGQRPVTGPGVRKYPVHDGTGQLQLPRGLGQADAAYVGRPVVHERLHIREVHRRRQQHPYARQRSAQAAERDLRELRARPVHLRHATSFRLVGAVRTAARERPSVRESWPRRNGAGRLATRLDLDGVLRVPAESAHRQGSIEHRPWLRSAERRCWTEARAGL